MNEKDKWLTSEYKKLAKIYLSNIQKSCKAVVENAEYVKIDREKVKEVCNIYFANNKNYESTNWFESSIIDFSKLTTSQAVELLVFLNTINCSYWGNPKWEIETHDGKKLDGSEAMLYVCYNLLKDIDFNPEKIIKLKYTEFIKYFKGNVEIPLLSGRHFNIYYMYCDICNLLRQKQLTSTFDLFNELDINDEVIFGFIIYNFTPYFADYTDYNGDIVYLFKRAQLLTSDIINLLYSRGIVKEKAIHMLGCADYKIPQILNGLGILKYSEKLTEKLSKMEEFEISYEFDRQAEIEIRASTIEVIDLIANYTNLPHMEVNDRLWLASQSLDKSKTLPYHRLRTMAY